MDIKITPGKLKGKVVVPPSKSQAHRLIIAAALADGESRIENLSMSKDISATISCMQALGARIEVNGSTAVINGVAEPSEKAVLDCCESGSTLRFLIPVAAALGTNTGFKGQGKLPDRPITPYLEELPKHGIRFNYNNTMPFDISGRLRPGKYHTSGNISSQFITGLLFGLAVTEGESEIILTSKLESKPYVDITTAVLRDFGCEVTPTENGYRISGRRSLKPFNARVEGDYSQAAFFYAANALGSDIEIEGLNVKSFQGDKKIVEIFAEMVYNRKNGLNSFDLDCSDIPDLVPALAVMGAFAEGKSRIFNAERLRIKESDRIASTVLLINSLGGQAVPTDDGLVINGRKEISGGEVDACNDHRIAMAAAAASVGCKAGVLVRGAECVSKSYPDFWDVFKNLGGNIEVVG